MSLNVKQEDAIDQISDAVFRIIDGAAGMIDVDAVVRGDRTEGPTPGRTLWMFDDDARCIHRSGLTESWRLHIHLVAVVTGGDVFERKRKATSIVSRAMSLLVEDRRIGLDFVQDVTKERMMFTPPRQAQNKLLSAVAGVVQIVYNIREKGA